MINDWTITFDDGSTATYFNMTSTQAVNCAVNDWYPAKRVIAWRAHMVDVYDLPLDGTAVNSSTAFSTKLNRAEARFGQNWITSLSNAPTC